MFTVDLSRGGNAQYQLLVVAVGWDNGLHSGFTSGDGAGLVECDHGDVTHHLERLTRAHQDSTLGCLATPTNSCQRCGHPQRTGVPHHQCGKTCKESTIPVRSISEKSWNHGPDEEPGSGEDEHGRHEIAEDQVGELEHARAEASGLINRTRHL